MKIIIPLFGIGAFWLGVAFARLDVEVASVAPAPAVEEAPPVPEEILATVPKPGRVFAGVIVAIHDGDTITVKEESPVRHVRLSDCWAPEVVGIQKEAGIKARDHLRKAALGQSVIVSIPEDFRDIGKSTSMGRFIGTVWAHGQNLSELQVKAGHACKTKAESVKKFGPAKLEKEE